MLPFNLILHKYLRSLFSLSYTSPYNCIGVYSITSVCPFLIILSGC
uniref:Uncharacterized protein n=1 Tax=Rhizophora mucronata TaxID=61149 RepID=A0A2P2R2E2_RHIMU